MSIREAMWSPWELYSDDKFELTESELGSVYDSIQESRNNNGPAENYQGTEVRC